MVLSCSSVHASVCVSQNIVDSICCRVVDRVSPNLHRHCIIYGTEINASQFGVKGQGHGGIKYAGNSTFWAC